MAQKNPRFTIGQKIIAIENHPQNAFNKGEVFRVTGVYESCCGWNITVGIFCRNTAQCCTTCGRVFHSEREWRFSEKRFSLIDDLYRDITQEILEKYPIVDEVSDLIPETV